MNKIGGTPVGRHRGEIRPFNINVIYMIGEAIKSIAKVGGYLARKFDELPGLKNLWRGMSRLHQFY